MTRTDEYRRMTVEEINEAWHKMKEAGAKDFGGVVSFFALGIRHRESELLPRITELEAEVAKLRKIESLQLRISDWQDATFPNSTLESVFKHLCKEVIELRDALLSGDIAKIKEELADCQHLLFGLASKKGVNQLGVTEDKFGINQIREWNPPDEHGVVEHKKEVNHG